MGVGGNFWEMLKPHARHEGFGFLRNKRVALDLSYWIVQQETAIKPARARNPHLRLTFFRTITLFSKFGAYPVFVVDGTPSPLKSRARITRFLQASGIDPSSFVTAEGGVPAERNSAFNKCVKECVELLELLGIPVVRAKGEAEALCAQLNNAGFVEACITSDSDAFLYGAKCVIKAIHPNSEAPLECYFMSDIEAGLGMKRNHLIAIALLVGNDHDLNGVHGIGLETAVRFAKSCGEEEILKRLDEIGSGQRVLFDGVENSSDHPSLFHNSEETSPSCRQPHCSFCGHPGTKNAHSKSSCAFCRNSAGEGCVRKSGGFLCECMPCEGDRKKKEQKKGEIWQMKVCSKIALGSNFPNHEIMEMYLSNNHGYFDESEGPHLSWGSPKIEMLVEFLSFHQNWEPSYIRQKLFSMLSTMYLRNMASDCGEDLLHGQYEFDSIQRLKVRYGHQMFVVKWKRAAIDLTGGTVSKVPAAEKAILEVENFDEIEGSTDFLDEPDVPLVHVDDGRCFLLTDEDIELVGAAFPKEVDQFLHEKELKESKMKRRKGSGLVNEEAEADTESPKPSGVQLSITKFYRSTKGQCQTKVQDDDLGQSPDKGYDAKEKRKGSSSSSTLPKSVRRRLLFK